MRRMSLTGGGTDTRRPASPSHCVGVLASGLAGIIETVKGGWLSLAIRSEHLFDMEDKRFLRGRVACFLGGEERMRGAPGCRLFP